MYINVHIYNIIYTTRFITFLSNLYAWKIFFLFKLLFVYKMGIFARLVYKRTYILNKKRAHGPLVSDISVIDLERD